MGENTSGLGGNGYNGRMQTLTIMGPVPTKKNRQRIGINAHSGRPIIYKPKAVKEFEANVEGVLIEQRARRIEGPMEFSLLLIYPPNQEPDLDGSITTILDALQDGGLFDDDAMVLRITECEKRKSTSTQDPPRAIVSIGKISSI